MREDVEYVLPLRWDDETHRADEAELGEYLAWLARRVDVTVVDGSPAHLFAAHRRDWNAVRVVPPSVPGRNGKARGAMTGLLLARHPVTVIADDDVRYDDGALQRVVAALADADIVRPQNIWQRPRPWHARWDTGRTLVNRAFGGDFSGTVAVRTARARPGYDTDVLFENLELERTVLARGGRRRIARDIFVARRPATAGRFREQRVRQAYDSLAQPARLAVELAVVPLILALRRRPAALALAGVAVIAVAEAGRRRDGGGGVFGRTDALWAVPWVVERGVTSWVALSLRLRGGVPYRGTRLRKAANSMRTLRKKETR
ncbi:glycosyltransferase [Microbacterium sp. 1262]|uniref:glycosyltransferase n=1 Tax=Microbacterium sp. 1262 TaxID=3156415 RepID=UPI0033936A58